MSAIVFRCSLSASCAAIVMRNVSSRKLTSLSVAIESRMPVVISWVEFSSCEGSSPGRNSRRMNVFTVPATSGGVVMVRRPSLQCAGAPATGLLQVQQVRDLLIIAHGLQQPVGKLAVTSGVWMIIPRSNREALGSGVAVRTAQVERLEPGIRRELAVQIEPHRALR